MIGCPAEVLFLWGMLTSTPGVQCHWLSKWPGAGREECQPTGRQLTAGTETRPFFLSRYGFWSCCNTVRCSEPERVDSGKVFHILSAFREEWTFRGPGPIIPELLVFLTLSYCYSPGLLNENGQWSFALGG